MTVHVQSFLLFHHGACGVASKKYALYLMKKITNINCSSLRLLNTLIADEDFNLLFGYNKKKYIFQISPREKLSFAK